ncbi:hypothetical protein Pvag_2422 [Pantoea vagans C9-1]|nr:hypothetical protein Pvag_2422 [Pantoea vagans C9-1]
MKMSAYAMHLDLSQERKEVIAEEQKISANSFC